MVAGATVKGGRGTEAEVGRCGVDQGNLGRTGGQVVRSVLDYLFSGEE